MHVETNPKETLLEYLSVYLLHKHIRYQIT